MVEKSDPSMETVFPAVGCWRHPALRYVRTWYLVSSQNQFGKGDFKQFVRKNSSSCNAKHVLHFGMFTSGRSAQNLYVLELADRESNSRPLSIVPQAKLRCIRYENCNVYECRGIPCRTWGIHNVWVIRISE